MPIGFNSACEGGSCGGSGDCCKPSPAPPQLPNLAVVTWAHAVNSDDFLETTLKNEGIKMIEADVVMGTVVTQPQTEKPDTSTPKAEPQKKSDATGNENAAGSNSGKEPEKPTATVPIMAHPPSVTSDLSFEQFVYKVAKYNAGAKETKAKGVKLDFKSIEAVKNALPLIREAKFELSPVWINADILAGPGASTTKPVDAKAFFDAVKAEVGLQKATLSIGWTTNLVDNAQYTDANVEEMLKTIRENIKSDEDKLHPITFPVRAAIAAESQAALDKLVTEVEKMNIATTLTIWTAASDEKKIDMKKLQALINHFGTSKVYVDLDDKLKGGLTLVPKPNGASSLVNFGLLNVATFLFALFLRNGFY
ncbi:protein FAM151A-like isoform X2 [Contarinia nasturtii]|nr:protein FAM151A-like isoform X2 [Contarinia nasturtii]